MRNGRGLYESEVEVDFNMDQHNMQEDTILRQVLEDVDFSPSIPLKIQ